MVRPTVRAQKPAILGPGVERKMGVKGDYSLERLAARAEIADVM
jgi:hypothetical protein